MTTFIDNGLSTFKVYENFMEVSVENLRSLDLVERPTVVVFGKECRQNRNVGFFSDGSVGYRYSGKTMTAKPMPGWMREMMVKASNLLNVDFNGVLVNHYTSGDDYIGAHSDDERGLAKGGIVAGVSWGAVRTFRIRDKKTKRIVGDYPTNPGALMVMGGEFQREFTHEIPVQKRVSGERWSLTFRYHRE
jgi:alkylated DNA repair dioxygenase AlkB